MKLQTNGYGEVDIINIDIYNEFISTYEQGVEITNERGEQLAIVRGYDCEKIEELIDNENFIDELIDNNLI